MLQLREFARKPFHVQVVEVTAENIFEVAEWCEGQVQSTDRVQPDGTNVFIKVPVHRPLTERQTKAFVGDLVLQAGSGFKVYTARAFSKSFEEVQPAGVTVVNTSFDAAPATETVAEVIEVQVTVPTAEPQPVVVPDAGEELLREIFEEPRPTPATIPGARNQSGNKGTVSTDVPGTESIHDDVEPV